METAALVFLPGLLAAIAPGGLAVWALLALVASAVAVAWGSQGRSEPLTELNLLVGGLVLHAGLSVWWSPSSQAAGVMLALAATIAAAWMASRHLRALPADASKRLGGALGASVGAGALLLAGRMALGDAALIGWLPGQNAELGGAVLVLLCWPAMLALRRWIGLEPVGLPVAAGLFGIVALAAVATGSGIAVAGLAVGLATFAAARKAAAWVRWFLAGALLLLFGGTLPIALHAGPLLAALERAAPFSPLGGWGEIWAGTAEQVFKAPVLGHGMDSARVLFPQAASRCKPPTRTVAGGFADLAGEDQSSVARSLGYAGALGAGGLSRYLALHPEQAARFAGMEVNRRWDVPIDDHPCAPQVRTVSGTYGELAPVEQYAAARAFGYYGVLGKGGLSRHLDLHPDQKALFQRMDEARRWPIHDSHRVCSPTFRIVAGSFGDLPAVDQAVIAQSLGYWGELGHGGLSRHLAAHPEDEARFAEMQQALRWKIHTVFCPDAAGFGSRLGANSLTGLQPAELAARWVLSEGEPPHPHNAFLQLWLDLGVAGALSALILLLGWLAGTRHLPTDDQAAALALFASGLIMAGFGFSLWEAPWMAGLAASGLAVQLGPRMARTDAMDRGSVLVIRSGTRVDLLLLQGVFAAIRRHHRKQRIVLLTSPALAPIGRAYGLFDEVWGDLGNTSTLSAVRRKLRARRGVGRPRQHIHLVRRPEEAARKALRSRLRPSM